MAPIGTTVSVESNEDHARFTKMVLPHLVDAYALARWLTGNRALRTGTRGPSFAARFTAFGRAGF